jgi:hypothetical protein
MRKALFADGVKFIAAAQSAMLKLLMSEQAKKKQAKKLDKAGVRQPSIKRKRLIEELSNPNTPSITEAGKKAGYAPSTLKGTLYRITNDPFISEAIENRRARAIAHCKTSPEEVLGSAVFQMRSSMNDVLDDEGAFCITKARETGAVDLLKKHKQTVKSFYNNENQTTETTTVTEIEMLTNETGRKEVANYIGVESFAPKNTPTAQELARELFKHLMETVEHITHEKAVTAVRNAYPDAIDVELIEGENNGQKN